MKAPRRFFPGNVAAADCRERLAILPNLTHYQMGLAPRTIDTALTFLNDAGRAKTWNETVSGM